MKKLSKAELAQWLVNEHDDCGKDTYFSSDRRCAMTTDEAYKKIMKENTREDLISSIFDHSEAGQIFIEKNT